jgi:hypothetical protein
MPLSVADNCPPIKRGKINQQKGAVRKLIGDGALTTRL